MTEFLFVGRGLKYSINQEGATFQMTSAPHHAYDARNIVGYPFAGAHML
ncbi:MAG: hypothetical protein U1C96_07015 [Gallionella sp.]|nr:hypothetical protein [Gallionella sp.]